VVYHDKRLVKLDITNACNTNNNVNQTAAVQGVLPSVAAAPSKPLLITPEELHDFYNHATVKNYAYVGRALEIVEEPSYLFKED
jgi:hypothetical protein